MDDPSSPQGFGRRLGRLVFEQRLFALAHGTLAVSGGLVCALSIMIYYSYGQKGGWPIYGSRLLVAIAFVVAALPIVLSYTQHSSKLIDEPGRAMMYLVFLLATAVVIDVAVVALIRSRVSFFWLLLIYYGQLGVYSLVGGILMGSRDDF